MSLILGVIKNNWPLCLLILVLIGLAGWVESVRIERDHYKAQAVSLQATINQMDSEAKALEAQNAQNAKAHAAADEQIANQLSSALDAQRIVGASLTDRVRAYEALQHRCSAMPSGQASASAGHGSNGSRSAAAGDRRAEQSLAVIPADAQVVLDQLRACQATLKSRSAP